MLSLLNMKIKYNADFPQKKIIEEVSYIFKEEKFQLYLVGGAVRSLLMNKEPNDLDFTTDALPNCVKDMFKVVILTGIAHGTVTVIWKKVPLEITTFRLEGTYTDKRRPSSVEYITSLEEDLSRRDFTINALAYDIEGYLFDYFQGREDIEKKIIRAIGEPFQRFSEDALRILRACRFASQLNFIIENNTFKAMIKLSPHLKEISVERVYNEFSKIITSPYPYKGLDYLKGINFYELFNLSIKNKDLSIWKEISLMDPIYKMEKFYLFFIPFSLEETENFMNLIKFPNYYKNPILWIKSKLNNPYFFSYIENDHKNRIFLNKLEKSYIDNFLNLLDFIEKDKSKTQKAKMLINENRKNPLSLSDLSIKGDDLINIGLKDKEIGIGLKECLEIVIKEPKLNEKEILIEELRKRRSLS